MKTNKHKHPPGSFKTEPCNKCYNFELRQWKNGTGCRYGSLCTYAHSEEELRPRVDGWTLTQMTTHQPPRPQPTQHSPSLAYVQIDENIWALPNSKSPILMIQSTCSGLVDIPCWEMRHLLLSSVFIALQ